MADRVDLDSFLDDALGGEKPSADAATSAPMEREGYAWAADVYWVYEHLGERVSKEKAGAAGRYALWKYANKENADFMKNLLPKAMSLLEKSRDKEGDADVVEREETKSIAEMQRLLQRAIHEAAGAA